MRTIAIMAPIDLVQVLSEKGAPEVPHRFLQPSDRRPTPLLQQQHHDGGSIPVIDLQQLLLQCPQQPSTLQQFEQACKEWGFLQVVNHGIPLPLLEDVKRVIKTFLNLPMDEKLKRPMKFEPYHPTGYGRTFDLSEDTILDWVDALIHYLSPQSLKDPDYWPVKPPEYRETIEAYGNHVQNLVKVLLGVLSTQLDREQQYLESAFGGSDAQVILRVNHYPSCPQANMVFGLSPHSDGSAITVLLQDEVEGLQVKKDGLWFPIKPLPGALIVNMGDMMQLISNGRYTSSEHRAVVSKEKNRTTIVVFYAPMVDAIIEPVASLHEPLVYRSIRYGDYLATYMNKELGGKDRINSLLIKSSV